MSVGFASANNIPPFRGHSRTLAEPCKRGAGMDIRRALMVDFLSDYLQANHVIYQ